MSLLLELDVGHWPGIVRVQNLVARTPTDWTAFIRSSVALSIYSGEQFLTDFHWVHSWQPDTSSWAAGVRKTIVKSWFLTQLSCCSHWVSSFLQTWGILQSFVTYLFGTILFCINERPIKARHIEYIQCNVHLFIHYSFISWTNIGCLLQQMLS